MTTREGDAFRNQATVCSLMVILTHLTSQGLTVGSTLKMSNSCCSSQDTAQQQGVGEDWSGRVRSMTTTEFSLEYSRILHQFKNLTSPARLVKFLNL